MINADDIEPVSINYDYIYNTIFKGNITEDEKIDAAINLIMDRYKKNAKLEDLNITGFKDTAAGDITFDIRIYELAAKICLEVDTPLAVAVSFGDLLEDLSPEGQDAAIKRFTDYGIYINGIWDRITNLKTATIQIEKKPEYSNSELSLIAKLEKLTTAVRGKLTLDFTQLLRLEEAGILSANIDARTLALLSTDVTDTAFLTALLKLPADSIIFKKLTVPQIYSVYADSNEDEQSITDHIQLLEQSNAINTTTNITVPYKDKYLPEEIKVLQSSAELITLWEEKSECAELKITFNELCTAWLEEEKTPVEYIKEILTAKAAAQAAVEAAQKAKEIARTAALQKVEELNISLSFSEDADYFAMYQTLAALFEDKAVPPGNPVSDKNIYGFYKDNRNDIRDAYVRAFLDQNIGTAEEPGYYYHGQMLWEKLLEDEADNAVLRALLNSNDAESVFAQMQTITQNGEDTKTKLEIFGITGFRIKELDPAYYSLAQKVLVYRMKTHGTGDTGFDGIDFNYIYNTLRSGNITDEQEISSALDLILNRNKLDAQLSALNINGFKDTTATDAHSDIRIYQLAQKICSEVDTPLAGAVNFNTLLDTLNNPDTIINNIKQSDLLARAFALPLTGLDNLLGDTPKMTLLADVTQRLEEINIGGLIGKKQIDFKNIYMFNKDGYDINASILLGYFLTNNINVLNNREIVTFDKDIEHMTDAELKEALGIINVSIDQWWGGYPDLAAALLHMFEGRFTPDLNKDVPIGWIYNQGSWEDLGVEKAYIFKAKDNNWYIVPRYPDTNEEAKSMLEAIAPTAVSEKLFSMDLLARLEEGLSTNLLMAAFSLEGYDPLHPDPAYHHTAEEVLTALKLPASYSGGLQSLLDELGLEAVSTAYLASGTDLETYVTATTTARLKAAALNSALASGSTLTTSSSTLSIPLKAVYTDAEMSTITKLHNNIDKLTNTGLSFEDFVDLESSGGLPDAMTDNITTVLNLVEDYAQFKAAWQASEKNIYEYSNYLYTIWTKLDVVNNKVINAPNAINAPKKFSYTPEETRLIDNLLYSFTPTERAGIKLGFNDLLTLEKAGVLPETISGYAATVLTGDETDINFVMTLLQIPPDSTVLNSGIPINQLRTMGTTSDERLIAIMKLDSTLTKVQFMNTGTELRIPVKTSYAPEETEVIGRLLPYFNKIKNAKFSFEDYKGLYQNGMLTDAVLNIYIPLNMSLYEINHRVNAVNTMCSEYSGENKWFKIELGRREYDGEHDTGDLDISDRDHPVDEAFDNGKMVLITRTNFEHSDPSVKDIMASYAKIGGEPKTHWVGTLIGGYYEHKYEANILYNTLIGTMSEVYKKTTHNHNDSNAYHAKITYEKVPYVEFKLKYGDADKPDDMGSVYLIKKSDNKIYFHTNKGALHPKIVTTELEPGSLDQLPAHQHGSFGFTLIANELIQKLEYLYSITSAPQLLDAINRLRNGDYESFFNNQRTVTGKVYPETNEDGSANTENNVRSIFATNPKGVFQVTTPAIQTFITDKINSIFAESKTTEEAVALFKQIQQMYMAALPIQEMDRFGQMSYLFLEKLSEYVKRGIIGQAQTLSDLPQNMGILPSNVAVSLKTDPDNNARKRAVVTYRIGKKEVTYNLKLDSGERVYGIYTDSKIDEDAINEYVSENADLAFEAGGNNRRLTEADQKYICARIYQAMVGSGDPVLSELFEIDKDGILSLGHPNAAAKLLDCGQQYSVDSEVFFFFKLSKPENGRPEALVIEDAKGTAPLAHRITFDTDENGKINLGSGKLEVKNFISAGYDTYNLEWEELSWKMNGLHNAAFDENGGLVVQNWLQDICNAVVAMVVTWVLYALGGAILQWFAEAFKQIKLVQDAMAAIEWVTNAYNSLDSFIEPYRTMAKTVENILENPQDFLLNSILPHEVKSIRTEVKNHTIAITQEIEAVVGNDVNELAEIYRDSDIVVYYQRGEEMVRVPAEAVHTTVENVEGEANRIRTRVEVDAARLDADTREWFEQNRPQLAITTPTRDTNEDGSFNFPAGSETLANIATDYLDNSEPYSLPDATIENIDYRYTDTGSAITGQEKRLNLQGVVINVGRSNSGGGISTSSVSDSGKEVTVKKGGEELLLKPGEFPSLNTGQKIYSLEEVISGNLGFDEYKSKVSAFINSNVKELYDLYSRNSEGIINQQSGVRTQINKEAEGRYKISTANDDTSVEFEVNTKNNTIYVHNPANFGNTGETGETVTNGGYTITYDNSITVADVNPALIEEGLYHAANLQVAAAAEVGVKNLVNVELPAEAKTMLTKMLRAVTQAGAPAGYNITKLCGEIITEFMRLYLRPQNPRLTTRDETIEFSNVCEWIYHYDNYNLGDRIVNWSVIEIDGKDVYKNSDRDSGYIGSLVQYSTNNGQNRQLVLVHRGTDADSREDWEHNFGLISGDEGQIADAKVFYQRVRELYPNEKIIQTGHSLGGGIAQALTVWTRETEQNNYDIAITFNPAGAWTVINRWKSEYPERGFDPDKNYKYIDNYILNTDVVPALLPQVGNLYYADSPLPEVDLGMLEGAVLGGINGVIVYKIIHFPENELQSHILNPFYEGNGYQETANKKMYAVKAPAWWAFMKYWSKYKYNDDYSVMPSLLGLNH
ncbi:MAG: lipase family protein [Candidatus Margulisiibacteriota bacterium]